MLEKEIKTNPLYPTSSSHKTISHIMALTPIGKKNQMLGLLLTFQNSLIKESQNRGVQNASHTKTT